MKNKIIPSIYLFVLASAVSGCKIKIPSNTTPDPSDYGTIEQMKITNGFPLKNEPWVEFSDRNSYTVFMKK